MGKKKARTAIPAEIERLVLVEAGYRCSVPRCPNDVSLEVHHIDYDRDNHDPANLLVMCSNCHGRATRKEIDRKACLMIKDLLRMQKSSKAELEDVKDEILAEIRKTVPGQVEAKPLNDEDKGTQRPNGRIEIAVDQVMTFDKADIRLPADVLHSLVSSLYWSSEIHAAIQVQRIVMTLSTPTAIDHYNLGVLLDETGRKEDAEKAYRQALDIDQMIGNAWSNLGILLEATGRTEEAEQAYHKALDADPAHARAWFNLGLLLDDTDREEAAEESYRKAVEADPSHAHAWQNLGVLAAQTDRQEMAEQAFRKAIEIDPRYAKALYGLATLLAETGRKEEAAETRRKAMEAGEHNADTHNALVTCPRLYGHFTKRLLLWLRPRTGRATDSPGLSAA